MSTVSAVLIVKNEEAMLPRCLESVKGADEIIVCDTGSIDNTVAIAAGFTDKVFTDHQPPKELWSFAAARNHAKSKASMDWILSIDADEFLETGVDSVRSAIDAAKADAIDITMESEDRHTRFLFPRLFRNAGHVWWEGAAHNHLSITGLHVGDVRIVFGYSPAHYGDPDRTMRILERETRDRSKLRELFYLGREYYYRKWWEKTIVTMQKYIDQSRYVAEKAEACFITANSYAAIGYNDEAREFCSRSILLNPNFKEALLFMADLYGRGSGVPGNEQAASQWVRMADTADNRNVLFVREAH